MTFGYAMNMGVEVLGFDDLGKIVVQFRYKC
jgi:hypothetical protein